MARVEDVQVLFRNHELLVINKPFDVAMDGDRPDLTVEKWVHATQQDYLAEPLHSGNLVTTGNGNRGVAQKSLKFVHQLDYATSGVLCLAFSRDMAARLAHCFQMRYTKKWYLAVVHGHVDATLCTHPLFAPEVPVGPGAAAGAALIEGAIGDDATDPEGFRMCVDKEKGRSAKTMVQVLHRGFLAGHPDVPVTKVLLQPETGRRHQLRVHLLSIGHPIVGDATYCPLLGYNSDYQSRREGEKPNTAVKATGSDAEVVTTAEGLPPPRMCLHAWRIKFFETVDDGGSRNERTTAKKKRRREVLGFEERDVGGDQHAAGTEFVSQDPFTSVVV